MRVRLFIKMIVIYFLIVISTLTMLGVLLTFLINNYLTYNKQMEMLVKASNISNLVKPYIVDQRYPGLVSVLNESEKNLGTEIWIIDNDGDIIAGKDRENENQENLVEPRDIKEMQQGKISIRKGMSKIYGERAIWVIRPIEYKGNIIGGTVMFSPVIGIKLTTEKVRNLFIYSAFVSIIFSTIVVHFLARYVTSPLREMNKVAKQLAKGDFSKRVKIRPGDEIGDLSEAFNYMAAQIEKQEKVRRDFVADVSHELRSPLTNIQGFIEAMMDGKDRTPEDRVRYLNIIHKETMRLSRLVNELLDLSRLETGTPETRHSIVNLRDIIEHSLQKFRPLADEKNQQISYEGPDKDIEVAGHRDRLEQVITNLLDNANRYAPSDSDITVQVSEREGIVEVMVIDRGEGIPPEELSLIWERFYKVDKARRRDLGGTGLGLAIVKQIVESLGGKVKVSSEIGKGTSIGFELPVSRSV